MNLIEKWKNRETKKKLREENIRLSERNETLKGQLESLYRNPTNTNIIRAEKNIHQLRACYLVKRDSYYEHDMPVEYIKRNKYAD